MARPADGRTHHQKHPHGKPGTHAEYRRGDTGGVIAEKNEGLNNRGWEFWHATDCPCTTCGHTLQSECDAADCDCCSSFCR